MHISSYKDSDKTHIKQLLTEVFTASENSTEGELIGQLAFDLINTTESQDLYAYVATENSQLVGCIIFTRLLFESDPEELKAELKAELKEKLQEEFNEVFILAPVAIATYLQGKCIGQMLINYGLSELKQNGVQVVFTYGDPQFYSKVGFRSISPTVARPPFPLSQAEGWLCQALNGSNTAKLSGTLHCVEALNKPEFW